MKVNEIIKMAQENTKVVEKIKKSLEYAACALAKSCVSAHKWLYKPQTKTFFTYLDKFEMMGLENLPMYHYNAFEAEVDGIHVKMAYDNEDGQYVYYAYIKEGKETGEATRLVKALKERRMELRRELMEKLAKNATDYLVNHQEEICKYPTVNRIHNEKCVISRAYIVWACGANDEENTAKKAPEAVEMQETLMHRFSYCTTEDLSCLDEYYPCVFEDPSKTEVVFKLNPYIDLIIYRYRGFYEDVMESPALHAYFVVKGGFESINTTYTAAVCAAELADKQEMETNFRTFVDDMEKALWTIEDGKYTAYVHIIYTQYAKDILERAKKEYPQDMFSFELTEMVCPIFSYFHDEDEPTETCIKVTMANPFKS